MKQSKKLILALLSVAVLAVPLLGYYFGIFLPKQAKNENVILYGTVRHFSGSGSIKFYYYDAKNEKVLNNESKPWFWGSLNDDLIEYIGNNPNAVFKIVGKKLKDDCGYIENVCLEDIAINEISVK